MNVENLLTPLTTLPSKETIEQLLLGEHFRLERIVSTGQTTPEGQWYDQDDAEWVVLLSGAARLRFEGRPEPISMLPGDCVDIPAHCRHRVEWTDPNRETVWLTLHYRTATT